MAVPFHLNIIDIPFIFWGFIIGQILIRLGKFFDALTTIIFGYVIIIIGFLSVFF